MELLGPSLFAEHEHSELSGCTPTGDDLARPTEMKRAARLSKLAGIAKVRTSRACEGCHSAKQECTQSAVSQPCTRCARLGWEVRLDQRHRTKGAEGGADQSGICQCIFSALRQGTYRANGSLSSAAATYSTGLPSVFHVGITASQPQAFEPADAWSGAQSACTELATTLSADF